MASVSSFRMMPVPHTGDVTTLQSRYRFMRKPHCHCHHLRHRHHHRKHRRAATRSLSRPAPITSSSPQSSSPMARRCSSVHHPSGMRPTARWGRGRQRGELDGQTLFECAPPIRDEANRKVGGSFAWGARVGGIGSVGKEKRAVGSWEGEEQRKGLESSPPMDAVVPGGSTFAVLPLPPHRPFSTCRHWWLQCWTDPLTLSPRTTPRRLRPSRRPTAVTSLQPGAASRGCSTCCPQPGLRSGRGGRGGWAQRGLHVTVYEFALRGSMVLGFEDDQSAFLIGVTVSHPCLATPALSPAWSQCCGGRPGAAVARAEQRAGARGRAGRQQGRHRRGYGRRPHSVGGEHG